ncbi:hypothetical protein Pan97_42780 [Bremerella volcania]|uniref:Uncharacterized protein n=1 Tax=Bremerella volcania TaxID=2527984 RepID=A0A518CDB2_9BACT|nr:hypothetical protein [Bremerella volcania]QDU77216.1 hypothetical protein Pan97_42780 [Bremerella volcania]
MTTPQEHQVDVPDSRKKRSWRIRFSLLSMILLITVVALSISHWQMSEQLAQMKVRTEQLSDSLGIPPVSDPTKVTAIGVPLMVDDAWEWHLVIPEGKEYDLYVAFTHVPGEGLPENPIHVESITNGEVRINLSIEKQEMTGPIAVVQGKYVLPPQGATTMLYHGMSPREASWLKNFAGEKRNIARGSSTTGRENLKWYRTRNEGLIKDPEFVATLFDPDDVIVLRRTRVFPMKEEGDKTEPKTCAGMMVWLVPKVAEDQAADR